MVNSDPETTPVTPSAYQVDRSHSSQGIHLVLPRQGRVRPRVSLLGLAGPARCWPRLGCPSGLAVPAALAGPQLRDSPWLLAAQAPCCQLRQGQWGRRGQTGPVPPESNEADHTGLLIVPVWVAGLTVEREMIVFCPLGAGVSVFDHKVGATTAAVKTTMEPPVGVMEVWPVVTLR